MASYSWRAVSGAWATPGNWNPSGTPSSVDAATLSDGGGIVSGDGSAQTASWGGSGAWTYTGGTLTLAGTPGSFLPFAQGIGQNLTITAGTIDSSLGTTNVDFTTDPTLDVGAGGTLLSLGTNVGSNPAQSGTLRVDGTGASFQALVNTTADPGGTKSGFLTVGGTATLNGESPGAGHLVVTNGGSASVARYLNLGGNTGWTGDGTISAGGSLTAGAISVSGSGGTGSLTIGNATTGQAAATVTVAGLATGLGNLTIGSAGGSGIVTVTNGGTLLSSQAAESTAYLFGIGNDGTGSLTVSGSGAKLDTNGSPISVGFNADGVGTFTVGVGGAATVGTSDGNGNVALSIGRSGTGSVVVSGGSLTASGYVYDGRAGTGHIVVNSGGSFTVNDAPVNGGGLLIGRGSGGNPAPNGIGGFGDATVSGGGVLTSNDGIFVGGRGVDGRLTVTGGTVNANANESGAAGTNNIGLVVGSSIVSSGTTYVGTGEVDIGAGGVVNSGGANQTATALTSIGGSGTGIVTVSGTGALLDAGLNGLSIAANAGGTGSLTVSQGGSVATGSTNSNLLTALSVGRGGVGSVLLTDAGTALTSAGGLYVGRAGTGQLTVENGASLAMTDAAGYLQVGDGGGLTTWYAGGTGSALVASGGSISSAANITVGGGGTDGTLTINAGRVETTARVLIGVTNTFASGGAVITPAGTMMVAANTTFGGNGTVTVGAGGLLQSDLIATPGTAEISVGSGAGSSGVLNVEGAGATVSAGLNHITVGSSGGGVLNVFNQGTVSTGTSDDADAAFIVGSSAGAVGSVEIGSGGAVTASGETWVGRAGAGHLHVDGGGTLTTGGNASFTEQGFVLADTTGGAGDATVAGSGAKLLNTGRFIVGNAGLGQLTIANGGSVSTGASAGTGYGADIGVGAGAAGSGVTVTGTGSAWTIANGLTVGDAVAGALSVTAGGTVTAAAGDLGMQAGAGGSTTVSGTGSKLALTGALNVGDAGTGSFSVLNGATASAFNGYLGTAAGGNGDVVIAGTGSTLNFANDLTIGAGGNGELTLGQGATLGVVNNFVVGAGDAFNNYGGVLDPRYAVFNSGRSSIQGTTNASVEVENTATLFVLGGTATVTAPLVTNGSLSGTGVLEIDGGGTLALNAAVDASQTVRFATGGAGGLLELGLVDGNGAPALGAFAAKIAGFSADDGIVLTNATIGSATLDSTDTVLTLFDGMGAQLGTLTFASAVTPAFVAVQNGGVGDVPAPPCFLAGTRIATARGPVAVEALRVGDRALLAAGGTRPVVWIGKRRVDATRHPDPLAVLPVRVRAGAFSDGLPARDLLLSPDHALFADGVLIPVKYLIDDCAIARAPELTRPHYFHVELDAHDVILAEGLPVESYLDTGDRANFSNGPAPVVLHPDFSMRAWEAEGCAPLVVTGPALAAVRARLRARAPALARAS
jgi:T5SS/PEP-CTERM-associated repeat protein